MSRLCVLAVLLGSAVAMADEALDQAFPRSDIIISASDNACYRFGVHVASTTAQWRRGLMHVRALDPWRGMLFVYDDDGVRSMWMKNTFIPLDMLFVRADGTIAHIARNTEPQSLASVASGEPVRFVLELNAGVTARLGIRGGDRMLWHGAIDPP